MGDAPRDLAPNDLDPDDLHGHVRALEAELGIEPGFLEQLISEGDDWSFIIKLQALCEAAVTHLITIALDREPLRDVFARMKMGDGRQEGKLALAKRLELLDSNAIGFLITIGQIRNRFAHNVTNVRLRIEDYVSSRPENERISVWRSLAYFADGETFEGPAGERIDTLAFARGNPRKATWWSAMNVIAIIYIIRRRDADMRVHLERLRQHERFMADTFSALLQRIQQPVPPAEGH